jgi:hypothetical protein
VSILSDANPDGLLAETVGTQMEVDQEETKEETKQEETKGGAPEETSKYLRNTPRELIESVGIGIKEILYQSFQGWSIVAEAVFWSLPWLLMICGTAMILKRSTQVFYWKRWILGIWNAGGARRINRTDQHEMPGNNSDGFTSPRTDL